MLIKIILTLIFFIVTIGIGVYSRRQANTVDGFVLGGRAVGGWLTAFAYGTSYFSAVVFVGYAGQFGWKYGLSSSWIGVGNAIIGSLLAWIVLGKRTKLMSQAINSRTMPDFFGTRFNDQNLRIAASLIAFLIGEITNAWVLVKIREKTGENHLWARLIGSSAVGYLFDTTIFVLVAFAGTSPVADLISMIGIQYFAKLGIEAVCGTPLAYGLIGYLKKKINI